MTYLLSIQPETEDDLQEVYKWYENRRQGLGDEFLLRVEAALNSITMNPLSCATVHRNIRRKLTRRFPFGIFYLIDQDTISVLAVLHVRRNPDQWRNRSKEL